MRTLSANFGRLFPTGNYATSLQVLVYNSTQATTSDLTKLGGIDWVRQVQWSDSVDDSGITAKISLQRDVFRMSFSPLMVGSRYNNGEPLILPGRRMRISVASLALDVAPAASDYVLMADLHLDQVDFAKDVMELTLTDYIVALLRNTYIDTQRVYGTGYVVLETVMQGIIDDNINTPLGYTGANKITLQLPGGSPSYLIAAPTVQKSSVLDALNNLANSIGWCLRSKFTGTAFQLCFYAPVRSTATSLYTLTPSMYDDITQASVSKTDIRNYIFGFYTDSTTGVRQMAVQQDATSIAKYGAPPMKMELTEAANSQINTAAQMATLLGNALSDLKDPLFQYAVSLPFAFFMEVSDVYTLSPNAVTHDVAQKAGVTTLSQTLGKAGAQTQITVRGQPAGLYKRWFAAEARPGVGPAANMLDPAAPTVSVVSNLGTLTVNYSVADVNNWSTSEVYISTSTFTAPAQVNGKNQRPTATLAAKGRLAHFTINGLTPGGTYYVAVVVIDRDGNVGSMSNVFSTNTQQLAPYHENLTCQQDQLVRNPDLNVYTLGTSLAPDNWVLDPQSGGDPWLASMADTTQSNTGKYSLFLNYNAAASYATLAGYYMSYLASTLNNTTVYPASGNGTTKLGHVFYCKPFPVAGGELLTFTIFMRSTIVGGSTNTRLVLFYMACDANGVPLGAPGYSLYLPTTTMTGYTIAPIQISGSARTFQVGVVAILPTSGLSIYIDRFYVNRGLAQFTALFNLDNSTTQRNGFGNSTAGGSQTLWTAYDPNNNYGYVINSGAPYYEVIRFAGAHTITMQLPVRNVYTASANTITITIDVSYDSGTTWTNLATNSGVCTSTTVPVVLSASTTNNLSVGAYIRFTVASSSQGGFVNGGGTNAPIFSLTQVSKADR